MAEAAVRYWLFQANPKVFRLRDALQAEALKSFAVTSHAKDISVGDKVVLWQSGRLPACFGLATVIAAAGDYPIDTEEASFFVEQPIEAQRVMLRVEYNLWQKPVTRDIVLADEVLSQLPVGLPGTNFAITEAQYKQMEQWAQRIDLVAEPAVTYEPRQAVDHPLNLILYGPPGTGKTYQAVNHALSIIEGRPMEELALEERAFLKRRFDEYLGAGQIAFVTFHQAFAYEDFVEGIKPLATQEGLSYVIQDGIFKLMCNDARNMFIETLLNEQPPPAFQLQFSRLYAEFLAFLKTPAFTYFQTADNKRLFLHRVLPYGNLAVRPEKSFTVYTIQKKLLRKLYHRFESVEEMMADEALPHMVGTKDTSAYIAIMAALHQFEVDYHMQQIVQQQWTPDGESALDVIEDVAALSDQLIAKCKRFVLIIDEINRGNVPAIFGDLITLIESDKREGRLEAISVVLPYSKTYFSIPPNIFILGTMNSSDRSTAQLDLALRRRFAFKALYPDPSLLPKLAISPMIAGINLEKLLAAINSRIEVLLDRDFAIGHAYFLEIDTLDGLKEVFAQSVIPLLEACFYGDLQKIGWVLGRDFVKIKSPDQFELADFDGVMPGEWQTASRFELVPLEGLQEAAFIRIYDKNYQG